MNHIAFLTVMMCGLLMFGCDSSEVSKAPQRSVKDKTSIDAKKNQNLQNEKETSKDTEEDDGEDNTDEKENDTGDSNEEEKAIELETPAPEVDGDVKSKGDKAKTEDPRTALTLTSLRREDDDVSIQVRISEGEWKAVDWPERSQSATIDGVCLKTKETEIELQLVHSGKGTVVTTGTEIGQRKSSETSLEIGYESQGGCNGPGCQDDNIIVLACPTPIKVKGLK